MPTRLLTVDPSGGVTEQLLLAALLDAGAPAAVVRRDVGTLGSGDVRMSWVSVTRGDHQALVTDLRAPEGTPAVGSWRRVHGVVDNVAVEDAVRDLALAAMSSHVHAIAAVQEIPVDELLLSEVAMLDDLAMCVGLASALHALDVGRVELTGPVPIGEGTITSPLGPHEPLPDPVVVRLLGDLPTTTGPAPDVAWTTPLGAAWLRTLGATTASGPAPASQTAVVGHGARHAAAGHDGVLRVMLTAHDEELTP